MYHGEKKRREEEKRRGEEKEKRRGETEGREENKYKYIETVRCQGGRRKSRRHEFVDGSVREKTMVCMVNVKGERETLR